MREISSLHDGCLIKKNCNFCSFVSQQIFSLIQLLLYPDGSFDAVKGEEEVRSVLSIAVFAHILRSHWRYLLDDWLDEIHVHCSRSYWWKANKDNRYMNALLFKLIIVTYYVGPARRIGEEDAETWRTAQTLANFLGPLEGSSCFSYLLVFDEGELGEHFDLLNNAIVGHQLSHIGLIEVLRNSS